jgi:D-3-phosphoglycerate dehydrogenase
MTQWKILITDGLSESGLAILRAAAHVDNRPDISADELVQKVGEYDALIVRGRTKVTPQVFEAGRNLRVVGRAGVGVDNINLAAASAHNVHVVNAPRSTSLAVAELTLGLLFALARRIPYADSSMKQGKWEKKKLEGIELAGKTLGIIGFGNIGSAVGQRAIALGMRVISYDPRASVGEPWQHNVMPVSLAEVVKSADFITIHTPLTDETRNLINGQMLGQMKRGVYLICTARGEIIDETALLGALESGQVAGAALDVFSNEPPGLTALVAHPNVICTPHIGAQTSEAQDRSGEDIATEVLAALRGERLRWKIV